jgi:hypothetical protein
MAKGIKTGGRQKGAKNKIVAPLRAKTKKIAVDALDGVTPLEVMLDNMRFGHEAAAALLRQLMKRESPLPEDFSEFTQILKFRQIAQAAATDAAPFIHPKLTSVAVSGSLNITTQEEALADLE